ncbi:MAG TPA: hypothetical protein VFY76_01655 [Nocardioides sp.]|nr:hypothetical protein [Nocardioides sp.]
MDTAHQASRRGPSSPAGLRARRMAGVALVVLVLAAALFGSAWAIGGEDAVSDNWVGLTVMFGFFAGVVGSFVALATAVFAVLRGEPTSRMWLPLATFPAVVIVAVALEAFVFE